jgi:hypothetical protein
MVGASSLAPPISDSGYERWNCKLRWSRKPAAADALAAAVSPASELHPLTAPEYTAIEEIVSSDEQYDVALPLLIVVNLNCL